MLIRYFSLLNMIFLLIACCAVTVKARRGKYLKYPGHVPLGRGISQGH